LQSRESMLLEDGDLSIAIKECNSMTLEKSHERNMELAGRLNAAQSEQLRGDREKSAQLSGATIQRIEVQGEYVIVHAVGADGTKYELDVMAPFTLGIDGEKPQSLPSGKQRLIVYKTPPIEK